MAPVAKWFAERGVPVYIARGNHDVDDPYRALAHCGDLTGRVVKLAEHLFVAGIGWHGEKYFELPYERDLEPVCQSVIRQAMSRVFSKDRLILLTHYPPRFAGTHEVPNDRYGGGVWYDCVRSVVELLEPIAVVQGHNHRWFGATHQIKLARRETLIVNPGTHGCVLEIDLEADGARLIE
jgi:Icc-related predicted phosphoesterase